MAEHEVCESNLCRFHAAAFCDPHGPEPQGGPAAVMHKNMRGLIECRADHLVSASTDPSIIVNLSRAVSSWGQSKMCPHISRSLEAFRCIYAKLLAYEAACEEHSVERISYELAIGTGQRLGDCISMKWDDFDGEYMKVVQEKTSARIQVYCPTRLQRFLETVPRNGAHILAKNRTQHIGKRQVQKKLEAIRKAIGVLSGKDRLVPHGWRYTAATQLADAGVDMRDIQAVTGHKTLSMVQKYTAQANQKAASRRAQTAREQSRNETGKR